MEVKITGGNLVLKHKLKSNETYKVVEGTKFKSVTIFKKPQITKGMSNQTEDNRYVLFGDFDGVDKSVVLEDYKWIQAKYNLPPAYLFTTKEGNYHIICLRKFDARTIYDILREIRCDSNFKSMLLRNPHRSYVLRLSNKDGSGKPRFLELIGKNINLRYTTSSAHKKLLSKLYKKIKHPKYLREDNLTKINFHTYETS